MKLPSQHRVKGSRAQEAGILMAAVDVPLSFQKTLMPRKDTDQGAITGLSVAADYGIAVLIQEQIESLASFLAGSAEDDERRWRRVSILLDLAAIGGGLAMQKAFAEKADERLPRAGARTAGYWIAKSATAGAVVGVLQGLLSSRSQDGAKHSLKVVIPAAAALAGVREYEMRQRRAGDDHVTADWSVQADVPVSSGRAWAWGPSPFQRWSTCSLMGSRSAPPGFFPARAGSGSRSGMR